MQRSKGNEISEIRQYCKDSSLLGRTLKNLFAIYDLNYIGKFFSKSKIRGYDGKEVFSLLFLLRFLNLSNVRQLMESGFSKEIACKKDAFYDFMKNPRINWRKVVFLFARQTLRLMDKKKKDGKKDLPKCLIIDDSLLPKSGRTIEKAGLVFDHLTHQMQLGLKMLTLGLSDGKTFLPLDFSFHCEPGKKKDRGLGKAGLKKQFSKKREAGSPGKERELETCKSKLDTGLGMIARVIGKLGKIDYVLADSWFIGEGFIRGVKSFGKGTAVIGLMKLNRKITLGNRNYSARSIPKVKRRCIKKSRKMKCCYISLSVAYKGIPMRGYWIKMNGQQNWRLLISTNSKDGFFKALKTYQLRWGIEVFFKDCKQNLQLGGFQGLDFDAQIADTSIVMMNYTALALKKRIECYESIGGIFHRFKELMLQQTLVEKIWAIFHTIFSKFLVGLGVQWELFIRQMINEQERIIIEIKKNLSELFSPDTRDRASLSLD